MKYLNPKICLHNAAIRPFGSHFLYVICWKCDLQTEPVKIGKIKWWARARALRKFYKLAQKIDILILMIVLTTSCACAEPDSFYIFDGGNAFDAGETDTADDTDTDTADDTDTDTADDTDTDTADDTDTDINLDGQMCPWQCRKNCDVHDGKIFVVNRNYGCIFDYCCQPWPFGSDHPKILKYLCDDVWSHICDTNCGTNEIVNKYACLQTKNFCCYNKTGGKNGGNEGLP